MASMIAENSYLIPDRTKEKYAEKNKYLIVITDLEDEMKQNDDELFEKLDNMRTKFLKKIKGLKNILKDIMTKQKKHDD
jgi:hypothetical protein